MKRTVGKELLPGSPLRLWGQGDDSWGPGLAVSRSFGDKMGQKYGLIYEPEIKSIPITKSLKHIVMGSDGLFDQIPPAEMASLIHNKSGRGTCRTVAETAHSRWIGYADDVSAVLLYL